MGSRWWKSFHVSNPNKIILIATSMMKMGVEMLKLEGVNEKLDPWYGEAQY